VVVIPRKFARQALVRVSLVVSVLAVLVVGTGIARPAAAAEGILSTGLKVSLNCTASAERIRVTNETGGPIVVQSIGTLVDPTPNEPFAVTTRIAAGGTRLWQAGVAATGRHVLTRDEILSNTAGDREGIRLVTSVGPLVVRCPKVAPPTGEKWIEVNLGTQRVTAWQGDFKVVEEIVSTGKPGFMTPPGTFFINLKFDKEDMNSCASDECWNIPDVPWVMYFTNDGVAFHGVYWYRDFGTPRSHGCVNMPVPFAKWLYDWAPLGTRVWVHE
jgi:hypothetical protein